MPSGSGARVRNELCSSDMKDSCKSYDDAIMTPVLIGSRGAIGAWIKNIDVDEAGVPHGRPYTMDCCHEATTFS